MFPLVVCFLPAILIATEAHKAEILRRLTDHVNVDDALNNKDLVVLDAARTLEGLIVRDMPDANAFESTVGRLVADTLRGRPTPTVLRAYGEMVDVLWKDGKPDAAIRLEMLWNKLARKYGFALLCGYAMGNFYKQTRGFDDVCRQHAQVIPSPEMAPPPTYNVH